MAYPKEAVEAAVGLLALAKVLAEAAKDGVQLADVAQVSAALSQEPLKSKLIAAQQGLDKIDEELKEIKLQDMFAMLAVIGPEVVELVAALKKK